MEVLPHFWINYFKQNLHIIKEKNIKYIIHLSQNESFYNKSNIEEIRIPIDYNENDSYEVKNDTLYKYLFDITDYIHEKVMGCENVMLIGDEYKQDIDTIIVAYLIRFGKLNISESVRCLQSKRKNIFEPKCIFYHALSKFYYKFNS
jgi:hypothetical protein